MPDPADQTPIQRLAEAEQFEAELLQADSEDAHFFAAQSMIFEGSEEELRATYPAEEVAQILEYRRRYEPPSLPGWELPLPRADAVPWHLLVHPSITSDGRVVRSLESGPVPLVSVNQDAWQLYYMSEPEVRQISALSLHVVSPLARGDMLPLLLWSPVGRANIDIKVIDSEGDVTSVAITPNTVLTRTAIDIPLNAREGECVVAITASDSDGIACIVWAAFCTIRSSTP
jgi:hypothetical protein